ncbi:NAD(P)-binding protein, partial [Polyplosphaeria fusca]
IVAVAGGTGGLGRTIVDVLKTDPRYEVVVLGRKSTPELEQSLGARVLAADYTSIPSLTSLLETNGIHTLISTVNSLADTTPETNLITAASRSTPTKRIIPNAWSAVQPRFTALPIAAQRLQALALLRTTQLEWTTIHPGLFMEYFAPLLATYITPTPLFVDVEHGTAALPGDGEAKIALTYTRDIARYVAELLGVQAGGWKEAYFIRGEVRSWNQIVGIAEKGSGKRFGVVYDGVEKLGRGEVSELEGHKKVYELFGGDEVKGMVRGLFAQYGLWMIEGLFGYEGVEEERCLDEVFEGVR